MFGNKGVSLTVQNRLDYLEGKKLRKERRGGPNSCGVGTAGLKLERDWRD